jgi:hypothetical protein
VFAKRTVLGVYHYVAPKIVPGTTKVTIDSVRLCECRGRSLVQHGCRQLSSLRWEVCTTLESVSPRGALVLLLMNQSLVVSNGEIGDWTGEKRLAEMESLDHGDPAVPNRNRISAGRHAFSTRLYRRGLAFAGSTSSSNVHTRSVSISCHQVFRNYRESWGQCLSKCGYIVETS